MYTQHTIKIHMNDVKVDTNLEKLIVHPTSLVVAVTIICF